MSTVFPREKIKPPHVAYPAWLAARMRGENVAIPQSAIEKYNPKIEPTLVVTPGKIVGGGPNPPGLYVPPPMVVKQRAKVPVKFRVLNAFDRPIFGVHIRANRENLVTDEKGEAFIEVYQGHSINYGNGLHGWSIPNGAKRKVRINNMVPMSQTFPINAPTTIVLYPESGEFKVNGKTYTQHIIYDAP